mmetsp:Transcript_20202/g.43643  ORF Transcript_20202/g.43643 Transcript_20202/m.43643 type:complete len:145 (+) Transcript_20202:2750-3184(+)
MFHLRKEAGLAATAALVIGMAPVVSAAGVVATIPAVDVTVDEMVDETTVGQVSDDLVIEMIVAVAAVMDGMIVVAVTDAIGMIVVEATDAIGTIEVLQVGATRAGATKMRPSAHSTTLSSPFQQKQYATSTQESIFYPLVMLDR